MWCATALQLSGECSRARMSRVAQMHFGLGSTHALFEPCTRRLAPSSPICAAAHLGKSRSASLQMSCPYSTHCSLSSSNTFHVRLRVNFRISWDFGRIGALHSSCVRHVHGHVWHMRRRLRLCMHGYVHTTHASIHQPYSAPSPRSPYELPVSTRKASADSSVRTIPSG